MKYTIKDLLNDVLSPIIFVLILSAIAYYFKG